MTRILLALLLFGISFGYVEAAVVVYLRALYEPLHERFHPGQRAGEIFPLLTLAQLESAGPAARRWLAIELVREGSTLLLLAAAALALARNFRQWLAAFALAFGLWDICYYVFLKILINWPDSLLTWDLLFLLPVPWAGPVLSPVLVSCLMIGAGVVTLKRESTGRPLQPSRLDWSFLSAGGVVLVLAFCWDYQELLEGGLPNSFPWPLFALGGGLGFGGWYRARRDSSGSFAK